MKSGIRRSPGNKVADGPNNKQAEVAVNRSGQAGCRAIARKVKKSWRGDRVQINQAKLVKTDDIKWVAASGWVRKA